MDSHVSSTHEVVHQAWYHFVSSAQHWTPVETSSPSRQISDVGRNLDLKLTVVSWNIHTHQVSPVERTQALISHILGLEHVDVIFLQEVSKPALLCLLQNPQIRQSWYTTERDTTTSYGGHLFATVTLLSKARFNNSSLGTQWRVKYSSRFGRDALCCDVFVSSSSDKTTQLRLVNVHLDSPFRTPRPSRRPDQLATVADLLREAGHGLVAGDFNSVDLEDESIIRDSGLKDAWVQLHDLKPGFTWFDSKQHLPPGRLDKVALLNLKALDIDILHPGTIAGDTEPVPWSDHSGLKCTFTI